MNKIIWLTICLLMSVVALAQMQQGVVKTRGRMVNGQLVPGKGLQNALIAVRGRSTVLSQTNGKFSFPITAQTFFLDSVSKKGYQLVDADALTKSYKHSTNPLYLVMETPEQQQADLLAKERKLRRDLQQRLQKREDEVENLNVSIEEKNRLLQEINKERDDNEKIIRDLSKYYSSLDYDQLDEFQRTVNNLLENGQLEQADSMLRSRGDMKSRIREINKEKEAEKKEEVELKQRQKDLAITKEGTQKKIERVAADCYNFYQRFLQVHQNDSAAYYLMLRSDINQDNVQYLVETALFVDKYLANKDFALKMHHKALTKFIQHFGNKHPDIAILYVNIGSLYAEIDRSEDAILYLKKALEITKENYGDKHPMIAIIYDHIGGIYASKGDVQEALMYYNQALHIRQQVSCEDIADSYINIGTCYLEMAERSDPGQSDLPEENVKKYEESLSFYNKALSVLEDCGDELKLAHLYSNIGAVYSHLHRYEDAIKIGNYVLSIKKRYYGEDHPAVAMSYNNLGTVYLEMSDYLEMSNEKTDYINKALEYYQKAQAIRKNKYGSVQSDMAHTYNNMGSACISKFEFQNAKEYYEQAITIFETIYGEYHPELAWSYYNLGLVYEILQPDYALSIKFYNKALSIYRYFYTSDHPKVQIVEKRIQKVKK